MATWFKRLQIGIVIPAALILSAAGCSSGPQTGPIEVRWDKDVCVRCLMSVSDRRYSAQVRGGEAGGRTRVYLFDDLGCAVLWLEQQGWRDDSRTEIWVTDENTGEWLDARKAAYVTGRITPMDYGLGAVSGSAADALDFRQACLEVHARESGEHRRTGGGHSPEGTEQK
jgi:copper chaperone NosL